MAGITLVITFVNTVSSDKRAVIFVYHTCICGYSGPDLFGASARIVCENGPLLEHRFFPVLRGRLTGFLFEDFGELKVGLKPELGSNLSHR